MEYIFFQCIFHFFSFLELSTYSNEQQSKRLRTTEIDKDYSILRDIPHVSSTTSPTKSESDYMHVPNEHTINLEPWKYGKIPEYEIDHYENPRASESGLKRREKHSKKRLQVSNHFLYN